MQDLCRSVLKVSPALVIALALLSDSALLAAQPADETPDEVAPAEAIEVDSGGQATDGMIVVRDAETGEVRQPTAEEMAEVQRLIQQQSPKKRKKTQTMVSHRNGMLSMVLDESYLVTTVVEKDADGNLQVVHHGKGAVPKQIETTELEEQ